MYSTIILREVGYEDDQKTEGWTVCTQILKNAKLQIEKTGPTTELTGRSPFRK